MPMKPAAAEAAPPSRKPIAVQMPKPVTPKKPGDGDGDCENHGDDADGAVLAAQVRHGAFLDRASDLLHLVVARRQLVDPLHEESRRRRRR